MLIRKFSSKTFPLKRFLTAFKTTSPPSITYDTTKRAIYTAGIALRYFWQTTPPIKTNAPVTIFISSNLTSSSPSSSASTDFSFSLLYSSITVPGSILSAISLSFGRTSSGFLASTKSWLVAKVNVTATSGSSFIFFSTLAAQFAQSMPSIRYFFLATPSRCL